jgi:hypothetical protein
MQDGAILAQTADLGAIEELQRNRAPGSAIEKPQSMCVGNLLLGPCELWSTRQFANIPQSAPAFGPMHTP